MMKKYYLTVIALLLPLLASAYDAKIGDIYYNFITSKRTAAVTSDQAQSYSGDVVIPSSVDYKGVTYTVTEIAPEAFFYCLQLKSVSLPEGLTSIGNAAFYYCEKLTSIIIPKNVETIGDEAFKQCTGLTSLVIPNKVTSIGNRAFSICSKIRSITFGRSVKTIGDEAFYACNSLTSIAYLGSTPPTLGSSVFGYQKRDDCTVWVPNGCMSAYTESGVLSGFSSIQMIPKGYVFIDGFNYYVPLFGKGLGVQSGPPLSNVVIPSEVVYDGEINSVTYIVYEAFKNTGLTSITIPESVISIGHNAFSGCTGLTSITIPESVTSIGSNAFNGCTGLASISIPNGKIHMGTGVFSGTAWYDKQPDGLVYIGDLLYGYKGEMPANTSFDLRYGTTAIAGEAFLNCGGLAYITIPGTVSDIGDYAFKGCTNLTKITIPSSVKEICDGAFASTGLRSVNISEGVKYIDNGAFQGCTNLRSVSIPNSVKGIGSRAFSGCRSLRSVNISEGVNYIDNYAFQGCTNLRSVSIPNSVTGIYYSAFCNNTSLYNVVIGNSVSDIYEEAFSGCSNLQNIVSLNSTPPKCSKANVFKDVDFENCALWVPKGSVEAYMDDTVWGLFQRIRVYVKGDVTFDGKVDKNDLNLLVSFVMGNVPMEIPRALFDINDDGNVDAADVVKLISLMK